MVLALGHPEALQSVTTIATEAVPKILGGATPQEVRVQSQKNIIGFFTVLGAPQGTGTSAGHENLLPLPWLGGVSCAPRQEHSRPPHQTLNSPSYSSYLLSLFLLNL